MHSENSSRRYFLEKDIKKGAEVFLTLMMAFYRVLAKKHWEKYEYEKESQANIYRKIEEGILLIHGR